MNQGAGGPEGGPGRSGGGRDGGDGIDADAVIAVRDLRKEYGDVVAVDGVTFDIHSEEIFALVGPNGAGKTTTVELLECLRSPTSGSATILGHDVGSEGRAIKERIGVVPQSFHTFDRLTVRENVALSRRLYEDGLDVEETIEALDLADYADTRFEALSGGYQRRTGIAMALVSDPEVLFLDEPTTGLDPAARRNTWGQIERLADLGTTVVLTTHYMEEVEQLADRAGLLVDGRLVAIDRVPALVDEYGGDVKVVVGMDGRRSSAPAPEAAGPGADDEAVAAALREAATEVYRNETGDLVGLFETRGAAQDAFSDLHDLAGDRDIEMTTAGMEDVFLRLAGGTVDERGELT